MTETAKSVEVCRDCGHSLENNLHGFDQNDAWLDDQDHLVHQLKYLIQLYEHLY